jgi:hypothetical protein
MQDGCMLPIDALTWMLYVALLFLTLSYAVLSANSMNVSLQGSSVSGQHNTGRVDGRAPE